MYPNADWKQSTLWLDKCTRRDIRHEGTINDSKNEPQTHIHKSAHTYSHTRTDPNKTLQARMRLTVFFEGWGTTTKANQTYIGRPTLFVDVLHALRPIDAFSSALKYNTVIADGGDRVAGAIMSISSLIGMQRTSSRVSRGPQQAHVFDLCLSVCVCTPTSVSMSVHESVYLLCAQLSTS